jgi:taurine dioxygenase
MSDLSSPAQHPSAGPAPYQGAPTRSLFTVRDLTPTLGAEIIGVDLTKPIAPEVFEAIHAVWLEKLVILIRGPKLSQDDQVRFAELFGPLKSRTRTDAANHNKGNDAVMFVSNLRENGQLVGSHPDGEMHFHSDQSHQEKPCAATMLYAMEVPSTGGNTLFANAYYAYETLPQSVRDQIDGLRAIHAYDYEHGETRSGTVRPGVPQASHPIVRTHPETGRKALYVSRLMTAEIEGMNTAESEELLMYLFAHIERKEFVFEHVWQREDLILWDNRCALHARTDFSAAELRHMRRVTIKGEKPV